MLVLLGVLVILALGIGNSIDEKPVPSDQLTIIEGSSLITYIKTPLTAESEQAMSLYTQEKPTFQHAKLSNMIIKIGRGLYYTLIVLLVIAVVIFTLFFTAYLLLYCYIYMEVNWTKKSMSNVKSREGLITIVGEINCTIELNFDEDKLILSSHLDFH